MAVAYDSFELWREQEQNLDAYVLQKVCPSCHFQQTLIGDGAGTLGLERCLNII